MTSVQAQQMALGALSILLEAAFCGMLAAWAWVGYRLLRGRPLLPVDPFARLPIAPWGFGTLIGAFILLQASGLVGFRVKDAIVGKPAEPPAIKAVDGDKLSKPAEATDAENEDEAEVEENLNPNAARDMMLANALYNAIFLIVFPPVFRRLSGAGMADLGLTFRRWPEQIQVGLVAGLLAAPAVYLIQSLAVQVWKVSAHPVQKMLERDFNPATGALAIISAVVLAPIVEEALFRGLLQGWLTKFQARVRPPLPLPAPLPEDEAPTDPDAAPAPSETSNSVCWPAVVITSLLFAGMHGPQWPAPIALFLFSMILGIVHQRTGSLLAVITTHGVLNLCTTLFFLIQQLSLSLGLDLGGDAAPGPVPAVQFVLDRLSSFLS